MFGSWKPASITSSLSSLLRKAWNEWDVRVMVLLSLFLQITLFFLGKRRKHSVNRFSRMVLWSAYHTADWVAIAAIGKLSNSHAESAATNFVRALWAPLLMLHLGGPDTITAYAFEDTQLWNRHILTLVVKSILVVYVIYLSWTSYWLYLLNLALILAGVIKYVERIFCLQVINSRKTEPLIYLAPVFSPQESKKAPAFTPPEWLRFAESFLVENSYSKITLLGYLLVSIMRPDANNYLGNKLDLAHSTAKFQRYIRRSMPIKRHPELRYLLEDFLNSRELRDETFDVATAELDFIFDVVYTKAGLIYTRKGCFLRLGSFSCSVLVLLLFLVNIMNKPKLHFSRVDINITISLLVGAVALEFFGVYSMLFSRWAVPVMLFHASRSLRKMLRYGFQYLPCLFPLQKRSGRMAQFNLFDYYWKSRNAKVYGFVKEKFSSRYLENWHMSKYVNFVEFPSCLKHTEDYHNCIDSFYRRGVGELQSFGEGDIDPDSFFGNRLVSFEPTRGERTISEFQKETFSEFRNESDVPWIFFELAPSIKLEFDASIIVWHIATIVCYYEDVNCTFPTLSIEERESSKYLSDYMMYLLAMQPAMLLPDDYRSFWLDACCDGLRNIFLKAPKNVDKEHALRLLLGPNTDDPETSNDRGNNTPMGQLQQTASELVIALNSISRRRRWKMIKAVWIEMLFYAACTCHHVNHVKQLGHYSQEFLSLIWIMAVSSIIQNDLFPSFY